MIVQVLKFMKSDLNTSKLFLSSSEREHPQTYIKPKPLHSPRGVIKIITQHHRLTGPNHLGGWGVGSRDGLPELLCLNV